MTAISKTAPGRRRRIPSSVSHPTTTCPSSPSATASARRDPGRTGPRQRMSRGSAHEAPGRERCGVPDAARRPGALNNVRANSSASPLRRSHTPAAMSSQAETPVSGSDPATSTRAAGTIPRQGQRGPAFVTQHRRVADPAGTGRLGETARSQRPGGPCAAGGRAGGTRGNAPKCRRARLARPGMPPHSSRGPPPRPRDRGWYGSLGRGPGGCRCLPDTPAEDLGQGAHPGLGDLFHDLRAVVSAGCVRIVPVIAQNADGYLRPDGADLRGSFRPGGCLSTVCRRCRRRASVAVARHAHGRACSL